MLHWPADRSGRPIPPKERREFRNVECWRECGKGRRMRRIAAVCLGSFWLVGTAGTGLALDRPTWADGVFGERRWDYVPRRQQSEPPSRPPVQREPLPLRDDVREGGLRPEITPAAPAIVAFAHDYQANSIVIDTTGRKLYFVLRDKRAHARRHHCLSRGAPA